MEYRTLGETGIEVSGICFGTSRFAREVDGAVQTTKEEAHHLLDAYAERGGNFLDTAEVYGHPSGTCERWIGEWLAERNREDFVIASKVAGPSDDGDPNSWGASRKRIQSALSATLDRLGTAYVDLYYVHWWDESTPIAETLSALDREVRAGRIHAIGLSNVAARQLAAAVSCAEERGFSAPMVVQNRYNAVARDDSAAALELCADEHVEFCPYAGLAGGFLTGKYERGENDEVLPPAGSRGDLRTWETRAPREWAVLEAVQEVAAEVGSTSAQVALRWLVDQPEVTTVPIVASRTIEQLEENLEALTIRLSTAQRDRITAAWE